MNLSVRDVLQGLRGYLTVGLPWDLYKLPNRRAPLLGVALSICDDGLTSLADLEPLGHSVPGSSQREGWPTMVAHAEVRGLDLGAPSYMK